MFSIYYIASKSNQVCLWLPYVLNTTYSFPFCCGRRGSVLYWCDDVCSAVYRYYFCTDCTNTQCLLRRRSFASWVILIGCAKTDKPITGNITGSFCIFLLANPAWPSYVVLHDRLAINNKITTLHHIHHHFLFQNHFLLFYICIFISPETGSQETNSPDQVFWSSCVSWNRLPVTVWSSDTLHNFKNQLKAHFFCWTISFSFPFISSTGALELDYMFWRLRN